MNNVLHFITDEWWIVYHFAMGIENAIRNEEFQYEHIIPVNDLCTYAEVSVIIFLHRNNDCSFLCKLITLYYTMYSF